MSIDVVGKNMHTKPLEGSDKLNFETRLIFVAKDVNFGKLWIQIMDKRMWIEKQR